MSKAYSFSFMWLIFWQNCLNPTIHAMRMGAFMNSANQHLANGGDAMHGHDGAAQFDKIMTDMTGGDHGLLSAIKQIATYTMKQTLFSLDDPIQYLIKKAPQMAQQSTAMVNKMKQGLDLQQMPQMLTQFLRKTTGNAQQGQEVLQILKMQEQDPHAGARQMVQFMSDQGGFMQKCLQQSRKLMAFVQVSEEGYKEYLKHPWKHPDKKIQVMFVITIVLVSLWVASLLATCITRSQVKQRFLIAFRLIASAFCNAFFVIMMVLMHLPIGGASLQIQLGMMTFVGVCMFGIGAMLEVCFFRMRPKLTNEIRPEVEMLAMAVANTVEQATTCGQSPSSIQLPPAEQGVNAQDPGQSSHQSEQKNPWRWGRPEWKPEGQQFDYKSYIEHRNGYPYPPQAVAFPDPSFDKLSGKK
ncbi:hypothetical protein MP228_007509 [Amoeboaphelidium protococcarum]|nr:hypothetical protein MP228_007509 [Amoeboaphelidium protococcarum]